MVTVSPEDVLDRFTLLTGLGSDQSAPYLPFCQDAAAEIQGGERETCGNEAAGALLSAAASLAFYRWALAQSGCSESSFAAGDLKITRGTDNVRSAGTLRRESLAAASPYLKDTGFLFRRTAI